MSEDKSLFAFLRRKAAEGPRSHAVRSLPLPEALDDKGKWTIKETKELGGVNLKSRTMWVPTNLDPVHLRIRAHEMTHVAITPKNLNMTAEGQKREVPEILLQGLEDARVHGRWQQEPTLAKVLEDGPMLTTEKEEEELLDRSINKLSRMNTRQARMVAAGLFMGAYGTPEQRVFEDIAAVTGLDLEALEVIAKEMATASPDEMLEASSRVRDQILKMEEIPKMESPAMAPAPGGGGVMDEKPSKEDLVSPPAPLGDLPSMEEMLPPPPPMKLKPVEAEAKLLEEMNMMSCVPGVTPVPMPVRSKNPPPGFRKGTTPMRRPGSGKWGRMVIAQPKLEVDTRKRKKRLERKRWRQSDHGATVAQLHRVYTDQKVFRRKRVNKKREYVGSILLDVSGSMDPRVEEIAAALDESPAATIAIYSGSEDQGRLTILAKDGKRVRDMYREVERHGNEVPCGNCIDGPALIWLGTQPEPRIWVSDGGVTGAYEECTASLENDAEKQRALSRAYRLPSLKKLVMEGGVEWMKGRTRS